MDIDELNIILPKIGTTISAVQDWIVQNENKLPSQMEFENLVYGQDALSSRILDLISELASVEDTQRVLN